MANLTFPTQSVDVVGVFNSNFQQVFENARPVKALVRNYEKVMEHPIETGQVISDYKVDMPIEVYLSVIVTARYYRDVYQEILALKKTAELLSIQTRATIYNDMIISDMPHEETTELYDTLTIALKFRQVQIAKVTTTYAPKDETRADTKPRGEQNTGGDLTPVKSTDGFNAGTSSGGGSTGSWTVQESGGGATGSWDVGSNIKGIATTSSTNTGPDLTVNQQGYNITGIATGPVQAGLR